MIPVFEPEITKSDRSALIKALDNGEISGTFGKSIPKLEKNFAKIICQNSRIRSGAEIIIKWDNKELFKI